jgi:hypothetical protein
MYCQNRCLLSVLFFESKIQYHEVEHFLFYALTERDYHGLHRVGYFSKVCYLAAFLYSVCFATSDGVSVEFYLTVHWCAGEGQGLSQEPVLHHDFANLPAEGLDTAASWSISRAYPRGSRIGRELRRGPSR